MKLAWQPIATAPKNEDTWIVVLSAYQPVHYMRVVAWRTYHPNSPGTATWRDISGTKVDERRVTHWAPLPDGPE